MKYYVVSDVHSYFDILKDTLTKQGFFNDTEPHKLIVCGDLMDRGPGSKELEAFIVDLMEKDEVILVKGNHEDLFLDMVDKFIEYRDGIYFHSSHHWSNGTARTGLDLTGINDVVEYDNYFDIKCRQTDFYKKIIPACRNYFETKNYIFVHGWIPVVSTDYRSYFAYLDDWRNASDEQWDKARWLNGMSVGIKYKVTEPNKTIVCGHWHTSWARNYFDNEKEFSHVHSNFDPYYADGIIAIDACTAFSNQINCIVIEDDEL